MIKKRNKKKMKKKYGMLLIKSKNKKKSKETMTKTSVDTLPDKWYVASQTVLTNLRFGNSVPSFWKKTQKVPTISPVQNKKAEILANISKSILDRILTVKMFRKMKILPVFIRPVPGTYLAKLNSFLDRELFRNFWF